MSWICERCNYDSSDYDEFVFLCGEIVVEDEEHGGSGDIDTILCTECYYE